MRTFLIRTVFQIMVSMCLAGSLYGQQTKQYSFKHFSVLNGLAANTIRAVIQDGEGYIWMATLNGLQRYDGSCFLNFHYEKNNPASIPSNSLQSFYLDQKKNLWLISDNQKIGIFDTRRFLFREASVRGGASRMWRHFFELPDGQLTLLQEGGLLYRYVPSRNEFVPDDNLVPRPKGWNRDKITWDPFEKKIWMSADSGLAQYDPLTRHLNYRGHNEDNDPVIRAFGMQPKAVDVTTDGRGNIMFVDWPPWVGVATYYRYDRNKNRADSFIFIKQLRYHEPQGFLVQRNHRVWLYGMPFLGEWRDGRHDLDLIPNEYRNEQSLKFDYAFNAFEDRQNNIWLATDNGVYLFNPDTQVFNSYNVARPDGKPAFEAIVQAMEETSDGNILVGTWGQGMYCFDKDLKPIQLPEALREKTLHYSVWDMTTHPKSGDIWITLQGGALSVYNQKTKKLKELKPGIFNNSTIRQVDEDTSGNLWFGTQDGRLIKWDYLNSGNDPSKGYELILKTSRIHKVHYDYQGYIWVATMNNGLLKVDCHTGKLVRTFTTSGKEDERLFNNGPTDMTYYNDSTLAVTAGCLNIINTRTNKVSYFSTADGLPSNLAQSVQKDNKGILWIGMLNGLCRLNLEKRVISYYDRRDGIPVDKFSIAAVKELKDGRLVFYTDHNFLIFNPNLFGQQTMPPKPYITGFKLAGHSLTLDSIIKENRALLKYNNTSIGINFSALSYLQQRKLHFFYMLEGLDEQWIHTDQPIEAIYNYLPPGNYVFRVKSENADGITSQEIASLPIVVRAPIWKTWWFYSMIALLLVAILYLLDRERMNKRRSLQQMRSQIGLNLHNEVNLALNNINVLSEIAKIKADKNVAQSKEYIEQISDKSRHMIEAMDDMLWSIDPSNDSMKKTVLRIKELTEGLRIAHDTEIDLIVDHKVQELELDMKLRHELFFFYKEAIMFIINNIPCVQVFVNLNKVRSKMMMEILCECHDDTDPFRAKFKAAVNSRVKALPATLEVVADHKSFAVVLYVDIK